MQTNSKESKKQAKEVLCEGGTEGAPEGEAKKSKTDRKLDKYSDDINSFKEGIDKEKFNKGIVRERVITDPLCGIVFIVFCVFLVGLL